MRLEYLAGNRKPQTRPLHVAFGLLLGEVAVPYVVELVGGDAFSLVAHLEARHFVAHGKHHAYVHVALVVCDLEIRLGGERVDLQSSYKIGETRMKLIKTVSDWQLILNVVLILTIL